MVLIFGYSLSLFGLLWALLILLLALLITQWLILVLTRTALLLLLVLNPNLFIFLELNEQLVQSHPFFNRFLYPIHMSLWILIYLLQLHVLFNRQGWILSLGILRSCPLLIVLTQLVPLIVLYWRLGLDLRIYMLLFEVCVLIGHLTIANINLCGTLLTMD